MQINKPNKAPRTQQGTPAVPSTPLAELHRTVLACLLWEKQFYESGADIAARIRELVPKCKPSDVSNLAVWARTRLHLRHVPLLLMRELARHPGKPWFSTALTTVIQRADELTEFLAIYWLEGKRPLPKQVKKGLAGAFRKFDAYQLGKYNRDGAVKLRDVLFLTHPKPKDEEQAAVWKQLAEGTLPAPDTWEVALSAGADKKATFERLMEDGNLGYMALLRNLRNMEEANVDRGMIKACLLEGAEKSRALPFRFIAAAKAAPSFEPTLDEAMIRSVTSLPKLPGKTLVLIDVSGSMNYKLSERSDLTRMQAAAALAVLVRAVAEDCLVYTFSEKLVMVPPRNGMALIDAIAHSQHNVGTYLGKAIETLREAQPECDRLIVVTDEQSADLVRGPIGRGYMINVASNKNGVGYGDWTRITGFSEAVVQYIQSVEGEV